MDQARQQRHEKRKAERRKEEEKAKEAAGRRSRGQMAIRRSRNRRRLLTAIVVMIIIGLISFSVINIISLKKEQYDMKEQKRTLQEEKKQLERELEDANDPDNLEEQARDLGFHFIFIEHDLEDSRTVSRQDMRKCVNNYMSVVLGEQPLDPTIVEFDDSAAY